MCWVESPAMISVCVLYSLDSSCIFNNSWEIHEVTMQRKKRGHRSLQLLARNPTHLGQHLTELSCGEPKDSPYIPQCPKEGHGTEKPRECLALSDWLHFRDNWQSFSLSLLIQCGWLERISGSSHRPCLGMVLARYPKEKVLLSPESRFLSLREAQRPEMCSCCFPRTTKPIHLSKTCLLRHSHPA